MEIIENLENFKLETISFDSLFSLIGGDKIHFKICCNSKRMMTSRKSLYEPHEVGGLKALVDCITKS